MQKPTSNPAKPRRSDASRTNAASAERGVDVAPTETVPTPRAAALLHLVDDLRAALVGGDTGTALVLSETIGTLLRAPASAPSTGVVDLDAERKRRSGV